MDTWTISGLHSLTVSVCLFADYVCVRCWQRVNESETEITYSSRQMHVTLCKGLHRNLKYATALLLTTRMKYSCHSSSRSDRKVACSVVQLNVCDSVCYVGSLMKSTEGSNCIYKPNSLIVAPHFKSQVMFLLIIIPGLMCNSVGGIGSFPITGYRSITTAQKSIVS